MTPSYKFLVTYFKSIFGMTTFTLLPKWYPVYAFPILIGTILLAFLFGKAIAWWDNFRVRRARARDNFSDEEAPYGTPAPRPLGPSRNPSRRNPSTRRAPTVVSEKLWEEDRTDRRQSSRQYNQRIKFVHKPSVILKPPVRKASERERNRYNMPTNHATYAKRSNSSRRIPIAERAEDTEIHNTTDQQPRGRQGPSSTVYRAKGGPSAPPPPPPSPIPLFRPL